MLQAREVDGSGLSYEEQIASEEKKLADAATVFTRPRPPIREDMDMTPMVDVTFLLLIFFMITASFSVQKSIQRPAQRKDDPSINAVEITDEDNPDIVTVQVDEFNAYNVITTDWDQLAGSKQDLIVALGTAHEGDSSGNKPTKLVVQAHEDCMHGAVIDALDAGREALFESFEVSTVEQFD
jgi:biopolymer transport protein ExbD